MLSNFLLSNGTLGYGVTTDVSVSLNGIGKLIRALIEGISNNIGAIGVGIGIIVFTIILKTIVLPLDIYSRIKGKKQALIMERMRPQMEKLQKQYANDKQMYNQKVLELQKKSGYSMFGACLPMIVSLVIFIVVFNAFSTYSQYANLESYKSMAKEYNNVVQTYIYDESDTSATKGFLTEIVFNPDTNTWVEWEAYKAGLEADATLTQKEKDRALKTATNKWKHDYTVYSYDLFCERVKAETTLISENSGLPTWFEGKDVTTTDKFFVVYMQEVYKPSKKNYVGLFDENIVNKTEGGELTAEARTARNVIVNHYLEGPAAKAVRDYYRNGHNNKFLWVGNLWYPDSTLNKEVPSFSKFTSTITKAGIGSEYSDAYNKVTAGLSYEKNHYNGYFILIILSIGLMLLQQFISMRANKSVSDLSTVDGSGNRTNKWMLVMMPLIYGIFSFFYSAAFSLYMITNTIYGLVTMLIINKSVDVWFKKKEERGELEEVLNKGAKKRAARAAKAANARKGR